MKYENSSGGSVLLYGQFNPAYQWVDDGTETYDEIVDSAHSNSRVGLWVTQPYSVGTFTFNFETALGLRQSDGVSQIFTPQGASWDRTKLRKIDFAFEHDTAGKFYAGQGSMATDGIAEFDFSGTSLVNYSSIGDTAGSFTFRTAGGALSTVAIADVMSNLDGGRKGRIRYDTPDFNGFGVSIAAGQEILVSNSDDEFYDIAFTYGTEFNGGQVEGGIGFSRRDRNGVDTDDTIGSVGVLLDSGLNFAFAAGSRKDSGDYVYGKVGYIGNWFQAGSTAIAIDIYDGSDFNSQGSSSRAWGIGAVQQIDNANTEVYFGWRTYEFSETTVAYQDIDSLFLGARWKF